MTLRMLLILSIALALVVLSNWLLQRSETGTDSTREAARSDPDYFIRGMEATVTGTDGKPLHRLVAENLTHYPDGDITAIQGLEVLLLRDEKILWRVTAAEAESQGGTENLQLQGNVLLEQRAQQPLTLHTESLQIDTATGYAQTDDKVTIESNADRLQGTGLQAYAGSESLRLLHDVKGRYATH